MHIYVYNDIIVTRGKGVKHISYGGPVWYQCTSFGPYLP